MIITGTAIAFLLIVVVILPFLAVQSAGRLGDGPLWIPPERLFVQVIGTQTFLLFIGWLTARENGIELWQAPRPIAWPLAAVLLCSAVLLLRLRWPGRSPKSKARLNSMLPQDARQRWPYAGVCFAAGIAEEVVYRGVLTTLLASWVPVSVAALISAVVFGISHAIQGPRAIIATAAIAICMQVLVAVADSLIPAMVVHALYDFIAGLLVPRWYARDAARVPTAPPIDAAAGR